MRNHKIPGLLLTVGAAACVLVGGVATYLTFGVNQVEAVGTPEYACSVTEQSVPPLTFSPVAITGAKVTVNNGTTAHNVELTFMAEAIALSSNGDQTLEISWGVDGKAPVLRAYGPADLVSTPPNTISGTVINVAPHVAAGTHIFQAYVTSTSGAGGAIDAFCAIAQNKSS